MKAHVYVRTRQDKPSCAPRTSGVLWDTSAPDLPTTVRKRRPTLMPEWTPLRRGRTTSRRWAAYLSWFLAVVWWFASVMALVGVYRHYSVEPSPSGYARTSAAAVALIALVGSTALICVWFGRLPRRGAAQSVVRTGLVLAIGSFVPLLGGFAAVGVPFLIGLGVGAGREGHRILRWVLVAGVVAVSLAAAVFWVDASESL